MSRKKKPALQKIMDEEVKSGLDIEALKATMGLKMDMTHVLMQEELMKKTKKELLKIPTDSKKVADFVAKLVKKNKRSSLLDMLIIIEYVKQGLADQIFLKIDDDKLMDWIKKERNKDAERTRYIG